LKKIITFVLVLGVLAIFLSAQTESQVEYKNLCRLGMAPLVKGGIQNVEMVRILFSKKQNMTKENEAVYLLLGSDANQFFAQIKYVDIRSTEVKPGDPIEMMAFKTWAETVKKTGKIKWAGKKSFEAWEFVINSRDLIFYILIPKDCGNLSIWRIERFTPPPEIKKPEEKLKDEIPVEVFTPPEPEEPKPELEKKINKKINYLIDFFVAEFQGCGNEYLGSRIGIRYPLSGSLKLFAIGGVAFPILSRDGHWRSVLLADTGILYQINRLCLGAGVGFSSKIRDDKKDQLEGLVNVGLRISKGINLFFEARAPLSEEEDQADFVRNHRKFLAGLRISF